MQNPMKKLFLLTATAATVALAAQAQTYPELVKDIRPGTLSGYSETSFMQGDNLQMMVAGDKLVISAGSTALSPTDSLHINRQLFVSDGSTAGTQLLKTINPAASAQPRSFFAFKDKVYFNATVNSTYETWSTDGTASGTQQFSTYQFGNNFNVGRAFAMQLDADHFVFTGVAPGGKNYLFVSDGTPGGTDTIHNFLFTYAGYFAPLGNGKVIFLGVSDAFGRELWVTDGTAAGTVMIKDINPGMEDILIWGDGFTTVHSAGDKVYFFANDNVNGAEPWVTDGTAAGTFMLKDIAPGAASSLVSLSRFATIGNKTYFMAKNATSGKELYQTDGTPAGTSQVMDFFPGIEDGLDIDIVALNGKLLFSGKTSGQFNELYSLDPATNATTKLGTYPVQGTVLADNIFCNKLYYCGADEINRFHLSVTDGTVTGTGYIRNSVADGSPNTNFSYTFNGPSLVQLQDSLYFIGNSVAAGFELFKIPVCTEPNAFPAVGISETEKLASLQNVTAFPNPSTGSFSLHLPADLQVVDVRILDLSGRRVFAQQNVAAEQTISHNLAAGMYLLEVSSGAGQVMQKLMVR